QSHYLFVGDIFTMDFNASERLSGYHLAVSGETDLTSTDLLDNLRKYVYNYNPSKVIIQVGITDFIRYDKEEDIKTSENIKSIIKEIKTNRPYAEIYIMSIYPINDSDNDKVEYKLVKNLYNEKIEKVNSEIKDICKNNSVTYIDAHSALLDSDKKMLNIDYTSDGLHLNDEGYKVVSRKITEAINK
ncbi:MAG: GDSL-type esterase/lipase family protein, partial [Bacilli bacterium]|nr:GDSL-type esterase/lipase family protein [Bacilli bacterium]